MLMYLEIGWLAFNVWCWGAVLRNYRILKKVSEFKKPLRIDTWVGEPKYWDLLWTCITFRSPWKRYPPFLRNDPRGKWLRTVLIHRMHSIKAGDVLHEGDGYRIIRG